MCLYHKKTYDSNNNTYFPQLELQSDLLDVVITQADQEVEQLPTANACSACTGAQRRTAILRSPCVASKQGDGV